MFLHVSVILSTGGGSASVHAEIPPAGAATPPGADIPPRSRQPLEQTPPRADSPLRADTPTKTATVAEGTHPTGMHSCVIEIYEEKVHSHEQKNLHTFCFFPHIMI